MPVTVPRLALALLLGACGGTNVSDAGASEAGLDGGPRDAGGDAGERDAAVADAGPIDAGSIDAGSIDAGSIDAGSIDAGSIDAGSIDAGQADASSPDASTADAGLCRPRARSFPLDRPVTLEVGTLCDDIFLCVSSEGAASAIEAASSSFHCAASISGAPCPGRACQFVAPGGGGPSTLDAGELREVCAVAAVRPAPSLVCAVYL